MPLSVIVKSGKKAICEGNLGTWYDLYEDSVSTVDILLNFPQKLKSKHSPSDILTRPLAHLRLRVLQTREMGIYENSSLAPSGISHDQWVHPLTVPLGSRFNSCVFYDDDKDIRSNLKSGDLLIYHEGGLLGHLMNLYSDTRKSRCGMILRIPDVYTSKPHLYVVELTSNPQNHVDALKHEPKVGVTIFKLWERVHSLQGGSIWIAPLLEPLANDPLQNMLDYIHKLLASPWGSVEFPLAQLSPDLQSILNDLGMKDPLSYCELQSASLCASFLRLGGKRVHEPNPTISLALDKDAQSLPFLTPAQLSTQTDLYADLIIVRQEEKV